MALSRKEDVAKIREIFTERQLQEHCISIRDLAVQLYLDGYGRQTITVALSLSKYAMMAWLANREYDEKSGWQAIPRARARRRSGGNVDERRRSNVSTADEWLKKLRAEYKDVGCETPGFENRSINLMCGTVGVRKSADNLAALITARLKLDPRDGNIYAFCGKKREHMKYLFWDGNGFRVLSRRRERGTYPWPPEKFGAAIPVTAQDFSLILQGERELCAYGKA
jgi:hypothetical protein